MLGRCLSRAAAAAGALLGKGKGKVLFPNSVQVGSGHMTVKQKQYTGCRCGKFVGQAGVHTGSCTHDPPQTRPVAPSVTEHQGGTVQPEYAWAVGHDGEHGGKQRRREHKPANVGKQ